MTNEQEKLEEEKNHLAYLKEKLDKNTIEFIDAQKLIIDQIRVSEARIKRQQYEMEG